MKVRFVVFNGMWRLWVGKIPYDLPAWLYEFHLKVNRR